MTLPVRRGAAGAFLDIRLTPGAAQNRIEEIFMDGDGRVRLESVQNANDQARAIARRLTDNPAPYTNLPWFWSHQGPARLQIAGLSAGYDETVLRGDPSADKFSVFLYRRGRLIAVESVNAPADHLAARRLIEKGITVPPDVAADPTSDLKALATQPA